MKNIYGESFNLLVPGRNCDWTSINIDIFQEKDKTQCGLIHVDQVSEVFRMYEVSFQLRRDSRFSIIGLLVIVIVTTFQNQVEEKVPIVEQFK